MKKKFLVMLMAATIFSSLTNLIWVSAESDETTATVIVPNGAYSETKTYYDSQDANVIVGIENVVNPYESLHYSIDSKPSLATLLSEMPKSIRCIMENGSIKDIPVTWECFADDYENSRYYYFQFNPVFDENVYSISPKLSAVPYVAVFLDYNNSANTKTGFEGISLFSASGHSNETIVYNFLRNRMGLNIAEACGVLANIQSESSFNPNLSYTEAGGYQSYGICQWNQGRLNSLKSFCANNGLDYKTLEGQLEYLQYEVTYNSYEHSQFNKTIGKNNDAEGAYRVGYDYAKNVERCVDYYTDRYGNLKSRYVDRGNLARDTYWSYYSDGVVGCDCSETYAGKYICSNTSGGLRIRSGHGTSFTQIGLIPEGAEVTVSKSDGTWAHITYNGLEGYVHMNYLRKYVKPKLIVSNTLVNVKAGDSAYITVSIEGDKPYRIKPSITGAVSKVEWGNYDDPSMPYLYIYGGESGSGTVKLEMLDNEDNYRVVDTLNIDVSVTEDRYNIWMVYGYGMGDGDNSNAQAASQWKLPGVPYTIPENIIPRRFGYAFKGWGTTLTSTINPEPTSPEHEAKYFPGDIYNEDKGLNLYATWRKPTVISSKLSKIEMPSSIDYANNCEYFSFTPTVTDEYVIQSSGTNDTYGELYSVTYKSDDDNKWFPEGTLLAYNDDSNDAVGGTGTDRSRYSKNFSIKHTLVAGETYFIKVKMSKATDKGSFKLIIDKASHTISFNANGGMYASIPQTKEYDKDLVLGENATTVPEREGYTFAGWSLSSNSLTATYLPGEIITSEEDMELYAVWEEKIPEPPFIHKYEISGKNATILWEKVDDAESYTVYYNEAGSNVTTVYETTSSTSCTISDLPNGKYEIYVKSYNGINKSEKSNIIPVEISNIIGDVNCDGVVNNRDLILLKYYLAHPELTYKAEVDVNGDGVINNRDLITLKYLLSKTA